MPRSLKPFSASGWFAGLALRTKVAAGFALLLAGMLVADVVTVLSQRQALAAVDSFLERDNRVAELTLKSSAVLLKARRNEKDFLLKTREYGYDEARSRYVTLLQAHLAAVRDNMDRVRQLSSDASMADTAQAIAHRTQSYETGFLRVVELHGRLGRRDVGLEGALRQRAHAMEALLQDDASAALAKGLLELRRAEKDFLLRGMLMYAQAFDKYAQDYRAAIRLAAMPADRRQRLLQLTDEYQALFHDYAATEAAVDNASAEYLAAVHAVEPLLDRLHARASATAAGTRATLDRLGRTTLWTVAGAGAIALLLGLAVALLVSREVGRALREFLAFASGIAAGDLSARLRIGPRTELGVLAASLNRMAHALQEALAHQQEQATEMRRLNRALRVLSQCNETLVRATSESQLVGSTCRHLVEIGGYRLAWVGYARHDAARSIEPAAHAGTDRDYVAGLGLSWGDDASRRGVGGAAVREGRPMLARHIANDAAFAPWREDALRRGLASCLALPLLARDEVLGMLSIYAAEADAFDAEEVKVLQQLANDLAYGIVSQRESEERARFARELEHHANFDALTGLANRSTLEARLRQAIDAASQHDHKLALLYIDLDRFKMVNDTLGHEQGDQLLIDVARRLATTVHDADTVARLGADEFVVLHTEIAGMADAATMARQLINVLAVPVALLEQEVRASCSIGISLFPDDGADVGTVMRSADMAMQHAKSLGGGNFRFFAPRMNERLAQRFELEADLRRALERAELLVHYQAKVSLGSRAITGAEALVRWRHPTKGMIAPTEFIPLAEETGLIEPLGGWVIAEVCRQTRAWLDAGLQVPPLAVNLSARQFRSPDLVQQIARTLAQHTLDPALLALEITESAVMHDVAAAVDTVRRLKSLGVSISLDDFGTGYSSLSQLKQFPIDHLKIDRSFVQDINSDADSAAICNTIIGLAHSLKMSVIAEGVETEAQLHYLRRQHCDEIQGYYFSRPVAAAEFANMLAADRRLDLVENDERQRTMLLVDDEPSVLSALKRLLLRDGYRIITATSASEGLDLLATQQVQVVLSDQRMPGMKGTEFLSLVKELHPQTLRIILSAHADLDAVVEAINRGAIYRYFTKPWDDKALRRDLQVAFRQQEQMFGTPLASPASP